MIASAQRPLWIARVSGTQAEMGQQHGQLLAAAGGATATIDHYRGMPVQLLTGDVPPVARPLVAALLRGGGELALARLEAARPRPLVERSRAFLTAVGRPASWSRYLAVMDLLQNVVGTAARLGLGPFAAPARAMALAAAQPACSTAIVWGGASADGRLRHARNFDFPGIGVWDAAPAIVMCQPARGQRYGFVTTRGGDTPVVTVWNEAGLVFTSHTRFHRNVRWDGATVVDLIHQLGAEAECLADVERIARQRPVASSWGIAVSSWREQRAVAIEIHGGAVAVVRPRADASHLIVANRYRDRTMADGEVTATPAWALHSDRREARLAQLIEAATAAGGADAADLVAMLIDQRDPAALDVVRHLGGVVGQPCQVHSVVVEPEQRRLLLGMAAAPVGAGAWLSLELDWAGTAGAWQLGDPAPAGFGVTVAAGPAQPRSPAIDAVARALAIDQSTHDLAATAAALTEAIGHAPDDPSLRMAMTWVAMKQGAWASARDHAAQGLGRETLPYRRGQLLLWGARAATAADDDARAQAWRRELSGLGGAELERLRAVAVADARAPRRHARRAPHANLFMLEADH